MYWAVVLYVINKDRMSKVVNGVFAAVSTPRKQDGRVDERSLQRGLEFLLEHHIQGFAINGATGETV